MQKIIKVLSILHIVTALNIFLFWAAFYSGIIFPKEIMKDKIPNFEGYYAWEISFTLPDSIMAAVMIAGAIMLLRNFRHRLGSVLLIAASGGLIFLGVLDFNYGISNGMFALGHLFSFALLSISVYLPLFGVASIYILYKNLSV